MELLAGLDHAGGAPAQLHDVVSAIPWLSSAAASGGPVELGGQRALAVEAIDDNHRPIVGRWWGTIGCPTELRPRSPRSRGSYDKQPPLSPQQKAPLLALHQAAERTISKGEELFFFIRLRVYRALERNRVCTGNLVTDLTDA